MYNPLCLAVLAVAYVIQARLSAALLQNAGLREMHRDALTRLSASQKSVSPDLGGTVTTRMCVSVVGCIL